LPDAEFLGGLKDAGVPGDEHQPVKASPGAGPDEGAAERLRQVVTQRNQTLHSRQRVNVYR
jgi:hypothetical protein